MLPPGTQGRPGLCQRGRQTDGAVTWRKLAQSRQAFASKLPAASYGFPSAAESHLLLQHLTVYRVRGQTSVLTTPRGGWLRDRAGDLSLPAARKSKVSPLWQMPRKPELTGHCAASREIPEIPRVPQQEPRSSFLRIPRTWPAVDCTSPPFLLLSLASIAHHPEPKGEQAGVWRP